jgi:hypothetical protein
MLLSHHQKAGRYHNKKTVNRALKNVTWFKYVGLTVTKQNVIQEELKTRANWLMQAPIRSRTFFLLVG